MVRSKDGAGKTVYEICEGIESEIQKRGAKCAFPVDTSINEVTAHYTAEPDDPLTIKDTDLVFLINPLNAFSPVSQLGPSMLLLTSC